MTKTQNVKPVDHVLLETKVRNIWTSQILFSHSIGLNVGPSDVVKYSVRWNASTN